MIRVLIVDDDPDILDVVRMELQENPDWKIETAQSAADAIRQSTATCFDVIISDYVMPRMNGAQLLSAFREKGCTAFIIIYSGRMDEEQELMMRTLGANAILQRRGDPDVEFSALKKYIRTIESGKREQEPKNTGI